MYPSVLVGDMDPGSRAAPLAGVTTEGTGGRRRRLEVDEQASLRFETDAGDAAGPDGKALSSSDAG